MSQNLDPKQEVVCYNETTYCTIYIKKYEWMTRFIKNNLWAWVSRPRGSWALG